MKGYLTTYARLFDDAAGTQAGDAQSGVSRIEIPLIQRDYAQGRPDVIALEIRSNFLDVLLEAISGGEPVGLDFIYGKVDDGALHPLDGQQRLTTLFLLHWYLASAAGQLDAGAPWTQFTYATRPGARQFCQSLAAHPLPSDEQAPSAWIVDQPWYLHVWRHDPTVQAMLVMLDAIAERIGDLGHDFDPQEAWECLTDPDRPAISFYLLPLNDMDSADDLYIKMNSRGKPLTPFENFKARFEQDIAHSERAEEFAHKIDGAWSDLMWPIHGGDNIVDDEFVGYLDYLTEICEFREGRTEERGRLGARARALFGAGNPRSREHLDFLFDAFDTWRDAEDIRTTFGQVLATALPGQDGYDPGKVALFGSGGVNLFEQCAHLFDSQASGNRAFPLPQSLLLYAVLLHSIRTTEDFPRRLRVVRNLIAASEYEVRRANMPALLTDVEAVIVRGDLDAVTRFRGGQVHDEQLKRAFLAAHPDLAEAVFRLEDNPILRGTLLAFDFDPATFRHRAQAFEAAFADPDTWQGLTGALLATGDYQRLRPGTSAWQFGTSRPGNESVWRYLLTETTHEALAGTRRVLGEFLDQFPDDGSDPTAHHQAVIDAFVTSRQEADTYDWRYHLVRYPEMRSGKTGIYYGVDGQLGYSLVMMRTKQLNGYYRDPILLQVWRSSGVGDQVENPWFTGYETTARWLRLTRSGVGLRSVTHGFEIQGPDRPEYETPFRDVCARRADLFSHGSRLLLAIPQRDSDGGLVDTVDRVLVGAALLRELVEAGL